MSLTITEAWIRDRVHLTHDNLDDVRSLSLPGTYQEKIGSLGNALSSFTRIKQIDLSRNGLQSLQGLQHLKVLEKLNLYYNNISSLQELNRLRYNTSLQEIDLRLNPVTKNEPDYRLYLVHMLPNLRKLDDRSVRESERKSALLHFDTDQATGMTEHSTSPARDPMRGELPRTKHVRGLGGRTAIEEDDSDLLDLLARTDGDLSRPRPVTGSSVGNPSVDVQLTQDYERPYSQRTPPRRRAGSNTSSHIAERDRSLYQTDTDIQFPEVDVDNLPVLDTSTASDSTGSLLDADPLDQLNDSNLSARLSPLRLPNQPSSLEDPLTLHSNPLPLTVTNNLVDELGMLPSDLWRPSDSLLEERKAFELEHKDLLSPTDTNSLIGDESDGKFGKARLSFSPLDGRRKLDFDTLSEDDSVVGNDKGILSVRSSLSMSTATQSARRLADRDFDGVPHISATPRGSSLIKAGDIYSSIMSQTRSSRARTRGQTRSVSPDRSPGALRTSSSGSTGTGLTSPSRSPGTHLSSLPRSPSPSIMSPTYSRNTGARLTSPNRSPTRPISPYTSPIRTTVHARPGSPTRPISPKSSIRTTVNGRPRSPTRPLSPSTSPIRTTVHARPRSLIRPLSPSTSPIRKSFTGRPRSPIRPISPSTSPIRTTVHARPRSPIRPISPSTSPIRRNLDQTSSPKPLSPVLNTRCHLISALRSPGTGIESSPLSKESKKSVSFMLGSVDSSKKDIKDNTEEVRQDLFTSPGRTPGRQLLNSVNITKLDLDSSQRDLWNSSFNRNNSNANEDSLIQTSVLLRTPQENRYSNLVIGKDKNDSLFDPDSQRRDKLRKSTVLLHERDSKLESSNSDSTTKHPVSSNSRILANSYSFSLHDDDDVDFKNASQSRKQLHSSSHSHSTSLHDPPTNMLSPTHTNHRLHEHFSIPVSLSVSPNPSDPITRTPSPSTTNKSQGSILDRPRSSDSNISNESRPNRRQIGILSDSSPHHVHHLLTPAPEPSQHLSDLERSQQQQQHRSRVEIAEPEQEVRGRVDSNLKFTDESDAYSAYSSKVNFTPNPKSGGRTASSSAYDLHPGPGSGEVFDDPPPVQRTMKQSGATSAPGISQSTFIDTLLNLVDRYWNGSKSLHAHSKFQAQAQSLLDKLLTDSSAVSQEHMDRLQLDVARYAQENISLRNKLGSAGGGRGQPAVIGSELQRALDKSQRDVDLLRLELQEVTEENRQLQVQLQNSRRNAASLSHGEVKESNHGHEQLQQENEKLKVQLRHVSQLQELATMLQESHKSLVTTNDHLLKELEETKQRHMEEVKQLHWSYNQLKQTMDITTVPPSSHHAPPQSTTHPSQGGAGAVNGGYDRGEGGSPPTLPGYGRYSPGKKVKGFSYSNGGM